VREALGADRIQSGSVSGEAAEGRNTYLALERRGSKELRSRVCRIRLEHCYGRRPCLLLCLPVSPNYPQTRPWPTYRFLELLKELMCLLFLRATRPRLHRTVCRHDRVKDVLEAVGGHVDGLLCAGSGGSEADVGRTRGDGGVHAMQRT